MSPIKDATFGEYKIPTAEAVAKSIGIPLREWAGNCLGVCDLILQSGLIESWTNPRLVKGCWAGVIEPGTMYDGRVDRIPHYWIEADGGVDGPIIIDPTRHAFTGDDYELWCGFNPGDDYELWCGFNPGDYYSDAMDIAHLAGKLGGFLAEYEAFRNRHHLSAYPDNPLEVNNGIMDKAGRIARYVKHNHREDPKSDWKQGLPKELAGLFNYTIMAAEVNDVSFIAGCKSELTHMLRDHSE